MIEKKDEGSQLVYSTDGGRLCSVCGASLTGCLCRVKTDIAMRDGAVTVGRSTRGRKGKIITVVSGLPLGREQLVMLAKQLKQKCGAGGTVKNGAIDIQGDHRKKLADVLKQEGFAVKSSGI
ncbi:MAG: hypothetical protein JW884_02930 [Deltaproteobacteria bacterium]|nr:hypothetical protein [Deltaproteobacteria bacterium]